MITPIIMHVDVNSAFLSWTAAHKIQLGSDMDLRTIPSVIGGNEMNRHGIVLAKSGPAKKYGIKTGFSLMEARRLCPELTVVPPDYRLYVNASKELKKMLYSYTPDIEAFSIDECFLRFTDLSSNEAVSLADTIRQSISSTFNYTVNIGISTNKLLAKMAGELQKPDMTHTCFPEEICKKLWPLPVGELFMVGRRSQIKLNKYGINTIGDLAAADPSFISGMFKSYGRLIQQYANGIDNSQFDASRPMKSIGNSSTLKFDAEDRDTAHLILLSLTETAAMRLRQAGMACSVIAVGIKDKDFNYMSRQRKLRHFTDCTQEIYDSILKLFDTQWDGHPIRQLGVYLSGLEDSKHMQLCMFDIQYEKDRAIDKVTDSIRQMWGSGAVMRGAFANSELPPMMGGYPDDEYPAISSIL